MNNKVFLMRETQRIYTIPPLSLNKICGKDKAKSCTRSTPGYNCAESREIAE